MYYREFTTDLCDMVFVGDENGISRLHLVSAEGNRTFTPDSDWIPREDFFDNEIGQIHDFLAGKRSDFDIKLNPAGTPYQQKVWQALTTIPIGQTATYKDIAVMTGNPKASRAVGAANGKNPIPIIVPCHRVIGSNHKLTGYAFGLTLKKQLLDLEASYANNKL